MKADSITIHNFDRLRQSIMKLSDDVHILMLNDKEIPGEDGQVGKVFVTLNELREYIPGRGRNSDTSQSDIRHQTSGTDASNAVGNSGEFEGDGEELSLDDENELGDSIPCSDSEECESDETEPTLHEYLSGAVAWLKDVIVNSMGDSPSRSFVFRAYSPKGSRVLLTSTFRADNSAWRPPPTAISPSQVRDSAESCHGGATGANAIDGNSGAALVGAIGTGPSSNGRIFPAPPAAPPAQPAGIQLAPLPPPNLTLSTTPPGMIMMPANVADGGLYGTYGAFRALGESYENYGRLVLNGVGQLQGMMTQVVKDMGHELHETRGQVTTLVDNVLDKRVREIEIREEHAEQIQQMDHRTAMAREAFSQFGSIAQAYFSSRGLSPEMADIYGVISSSPELMGTLAKPSVRALLKDPATLKLLAQSLEQVGDRQESISASSPDRPVAALPSGQPNEPLPSMAVQVSMTPGLTRSAIPQGQLMSPFNGQPGHPFPQQPGMPGGFTHPAMQAPGTNQMAQFAGTPNGYAAMQQGPVGRMPGQPPLAMNMPMNQYQGQMAAFQGQQMAPGPFSYQGQMVQGQGNVQQSPMHGGQMMPAFQGNHFTQPQAPMGQQFVPMGGHLPPGHGGVTPQLSGQGQSLAGPPHDTPFNGNQHVVQPWQMAQAPGMASQTAPSPGQTVPANWQQQASMPQTQASAQVPVAESSESTSSK